MGKDRKEKLLCFFKLLKENLGFDFNINSFKDRIKLQKYVFISKHFGLDWSFKFNMYIHGPYSRRLADVYYEVDKSNIPENYSSILESFDYQNFLKLVEKKDARWLELVATILSVWENYRRKFCDRELKDRVLETAGEIKSKASNEDIKNIFDCLLKNDVISLEN